jgi:hypothetical protein
MHSGAHEEAAQRQEPDDESWEMQFDRESTERVEEHIVPTRPLGTEG